MPAKIKKLAVPSVVVVIGFLVTAVLPSHFSLLR